MNPYRPMQGPVTPLSVLGPEAENERQRIRQRFESGASARETLNALCQLADKNIRQVFDEVLRVHDAPSEGMCLFALGGYGRRLLFPYSDLDLLFLFGSEKAEEDFRPLIADFSRTLWDLGFRVSSAGRMLEECKHIEGDNAEFHLALLDRRLLAGDRELFEKVNARILPASEKHARSFLLSQLHTLTKARLARYGNTIFLLEPNVKEAPGGLRDYQVAVWMRHLAGETKDALNISAAEEELASSAVDFLSGIRCFLHYNNERNDNTLTYEMQTDAAERSLGVVVGGPLDAVEWMRLYFRHARTLNRQLLRYLEHRAQVPRTLRERIVSATTRGVRSSAGNGRIFAVREGLVEILDQTALADRAITFSLFTDAARAGVPLSRRAERTISYIMKHPELRVKNPKVSWAVLRDLLAADYPGIALRPMQRLGLLTEILPEFAKIDSLVVRDFYHRYTVDEHSLRTIEHLQELALPPDARGIHFQSLWKTLERRDLLILSLLLHDVGKGKSTENPVAGSLEALASVAERLQLSGEEKGEVHFLIEHQGDMASTVQRRDIFDPSAISAFAATVVNQDRLQRLTLMTYADTHAVNPEALTPWKAEMLWQLYNATSDYFSHTLDSDRLHASDELSLLEPIRACADDGGGQIDKFLEGFPRRYLAVHSPAEIAGHFALYQKLPGERVQIEVHVTSLALTLTLVTEDRPSLFATVAGVLANQGMNIIKADAFANAAGIVLDTFHFTELHRTLELQPNAMAQFQRTLLDAVTTGTLSEPHSRVRDPVSRERPAEATVETRISFDDRSSEHSTLLEILTQDHPGLLYDISSTLVRLGCNIEVALIDTEGRRAIDVFYLTEQGKKLSAGKQESLREMLQLAVETSRNGS